MKIAVLVNPLPKTNLSPSKSVGKLLTILPKDADIFFYGIGYNKELTPDLGPNFHANYYEQSLGKIDFLKKQKTICADIKNDKPDIVLFWIADKMFKIMNYCKKKQIPTIMWVYGNTFDFINNGIKKIISETIFTSMLKKTTYIAEEHFGVMALLSKYDKHKRFSKKCVFHDLSIYTKNPNQNFILNFEERKKRFIVIARIAKEKNIDLIIEAFLKSDSNNDSELYIIGSGPLESDYKNQYKDKQNIVFCGWKNEEFISKLLGESKFYISASSSEGFPSSVQEAIKSKALVLCYPVGGLTSFLTNDNSIVISQLTVDSIFDAMNNAFSLSNEEIKRITEKALLDLNNDFSFEACCNKINNAINMATSNNKK